MYAPLVPCAGCRRHVRAADASCPFCGAAVTAAPTVGLPNGRLARSMLVAFATSAAAAGGGAATSGCSSGDGSSGDAAIDTGNAVAAYGMPADTGASIDTGSAGDGSAGDASKDAATDGADGGPSDTGAPGNLYGLPPPDGGK